MPALAERLLQIRAAIDAALAKSTEPRRDVTLVAVTKHHPASVLTDLAAAGVTDVGENRVQEALSKAEGANASVRWHLIGHLQRNKAAQAARFFDCIHSCDSPRIVEALAATERPVEVFLQVNVSGEATKFGAPPEDVRALWRSALQTPNLKVLGLMTMAPYAEDPELSRPVFATLRQLRDDLTASGDGPPLDGLSMGMSGDFGVAVEEGATHVRIGTALVGEGRQSR